jgi:hypothetical protein
LKNEGEKKMKRLSGILFAVLCAAFISCSNGEPGDTSGDNTPKQFTTRPALTLTNTAEGLLYIISYSEPKADSYDLYWLKGNKSRDEITAGGTKITNAPKSGIIPNLQAGDQVSAVVMAKKAGFPDSWSFVINETVPPGGSTNSFTSAPVLTVTAGSGSLICTWTASNPAADSYDLYYITGTAVGAVDVKSGTKITGVTSPRTISGLAASTSYSVVVTANKSGYYSGDSAVKTAQTPTPGQPPVNPPLAAGKSVKRGIGVNGFTASDMELMSPTVSWFYNWGTIWSDLDNARANNLAYVPMFWSGVNKANLRNLKQAYPEAEYILGFNEPNLTDQANMTPAQAAQSNRWPDLVDVAKELNLKIGAPAMNYGTLANYGDPIKWLDEFFALPNISLADIDSIPIHCYMDWPGAVKGFIDSFKKYGKEIWMTEWCAWETQVAASVGQATGVKWQMFNMSQLAMYMEQDPMVGRYAWFMLKNGSGANGHNNAPWWALVVNQANGQLTDLGKVYINMSTCDKSVWIPAGQVIPAKDFTANNLSECTAVGASWKDSVTFRPTTDTAASASVLDIHDMKNGMWVEYQVDLPSAKAYTLTMRFQTTQSTSMRAYVDENQVAQFNLSSGEWAQNPVSLGDLSAGHHTIRLLIGAGNCALNWLKVE